MGIVNPNGGGKLQAGERPRGRVIPFGKYLLLERIAVGGMAEVYLAKSFGIEGFEKLIAIKRILPTMAEDEDFIEMFIDEAKIAGHLNHANIVPIYELGKIGESHYIAMEFVWGKDLLQIMNRFRRLRKRMPSPMVAWTASKICEGLDYAHNKKDRKGEPLKLIHRDVSPQNILVSYEGQVKIIDFGIAKAASRTTKTQAGVLKGKFGYMSPEQVRGLPIDNRSDIFAVGTCMYEMITGERLFLGESDFSTLEKVRSADVEPPSKFVADVPPELDQIILRALSREPADRFQSAGELQVELQHYLASQKPPFGTSKLASWMKTAFGNELGSEKARLDSYAHIGRPTVLGGSARRSESPRAISELPSAEPAATPISGDQDSRPTKAPPRQVSTGETDLALSELEEYGEDMVEGEATVVSASPFDEDSPLEATADDVGDEATQIFFSSDEVEGTDGAGAAPNNANEHGAGAALQPPGEVAGDVKPAVGSVPPPAAALSQLESVTSKPADAASATEKAKPSDRPAEKRDERAAPKPVASGQRNLATLELDRRELAAYSAQKQRAATFKTAGAVVAAVLLLLGVGAAIPYLLVEQESAGTIEVHTNPPVAAEVLIDGKRRGRAPLRIERVKNGLRTVEVIADGFLPARRQVEIHNEVLRLEIALVQEPGEAKALAETGIGSETVGGPPSTAAATPNDDDPGSEPTVATETPSTTTIDTEPEETPGSSAAQRATRGPNAPRATNRSRWRETPPENTSHGPIEPLDLRVVRAGGDTASAGQKPASQRRSNASRNRRARSSAADEAQPGILRLNSIPVARVFVDGKDHGETPIMRLEVSPGRHRIRFRTNDGRTEEKSVQIGSGETKTVSARTFD